MVKLINKSKSRRKTSVYRALFESEKEAILLLDKDGFIECNRKCLEVFDRKRDQIVGQPPHAFSPQCQPDGEDSRNKMSEMIKLTMEGGHQNFSWIFVRPDGTNIDVELSFNFIAGEKNSFIKAVISNVKGMKRSLELYKIFAHNAPLGIYIVRDGIFVFVNSRFREFVGYSEEELIGMNSLDIVHPEDKEKVRSSAVQMLKKKRTVPYEFRVLTKDGEIKWIMETVIPIYFDNKREVLGNYMDISDNKRTEEILRAREERYRTILENIEDGYYELDASGKFNFFNDSCLKIFGYKGDELMGMNWRDCTDRGSLKDVEKAFNDVVGTLRPDRVQDWTIVRKDGSKRHIEASFAPIHDAEKKAVGIRGIIRDVTERKQAEETITFMAYHDALTGLPNRILFQDRFAMTVVKAQRNRQKFALMMLDLDNFKEVNDNRGHNVGDQLLQSVGNRLRSRLRKVDTVARMGGDEFMILLPEIKNDNDSLVIAKKIVESFRRPFYLGNDELYVTTSLGIAVYPDDGADFDSLKKQADLSMYNAKAHGRNDYRREPPNSISLIPPIR